MDEDSTNEAVVLFAGAAQAASYVIDQSPALGRCLKAARDLSQGEVVTKELPLGECTYSITTRFCLYVELPHTI